MKGKKEKWLYLSLLSIHLRFLNEIFDYMRIIHLIKCCIFAEGVDTRTLAKVTSYVMTEIKQLENLNA